MHEKKQPSYENNHLSEHPFPPVRPGKIHLNPLLHYLQLTAKAILLLLLHESVALAQKPATGRLDIKMTDRATGKPTPVRVRLTQSGFAVKTLPKAAIGVMYGLWDHADGYGFQPDSAFYVDGGFQLDLPVGKYNLFISKGNEYISQEHVLQVNAGTTVKKNYQMARWINTPEMGWYSGDDHIHIRRSPREDPLLLKWIQAEDIHVGAMLRMGDFWETYYPQYDWGEKGVHQENDYFLTSGQEDPRTPELGHVLGLGIPKPVRMPKAYYYYDTVFDSLRALGGVGGYAHQGESFHGYRGLTLDGLRNKVDMLEILQFCVSDQPLLVNNYYHLLDLGFPVTAVAGSDFPWCGKEHNKNFPERSARIGNARYYTYAEKPFNYQSWKENLAAGHTFVSSGPVLDFKVNNLLPGNALDVTKGTEIKITAHAYGHSAQVPLQVLEIVAHGQVLGKVTTQDPNQSSGHLSIELTLPVEYGQWIAARCYGVQAQQAAHTTPVYVTVEGGSFCNPRTLSKYIALSEQYLKELEAQLEVVTSDPELQAWRYRTGLQIRIDETRKILENLKKNLHE